MATARNLFRIFVLVASMLIAAPTHATPRDELVIGMTQYPSTLHPGIETMLAKTYVIRLAHRPFTTYDADWKLICMLCVELPTFENGLARREPLKEDKGHGKEGVAVTYTIQPEARWGDRVPVTTKDVLFTWEVGKHPQSAIANGELYRRILSIDVIDDKTFTLHIDRVTFDYNAINDFEILPEHLERARFNDPARYRTQTLYDADSTNPGLWFGPSKVVDKEPGAQIVFERNPTWWGTPGPFRRVVFRVIENTAALEANLLSGSIDMIAGEGMGLGIDQAIAFEQRHGHQYDFIYKPGLVYEHLDLNIDNPLVADVRVRRALLLALDRDVINRQLYGGQQPPAPTFVSPLDWVYDPSIPATKQDLAGAGRLLDEAGWRMGPDGIRVNDKGARLALDLMTTAGNRSRELVEQVLQAQWKAAGIETRIRNQPARVLFGDTLVKRKFQGLAMFAWMSAPENVPRSILHSEEIPSSSNGFAGENFVGFHDPKVDALLDKIEITIDPDTRKALWFELQRIYADQLPAIPLFFRADAFILPKWLKGVVPTGHQEPTTAWIEDWRVETPGQERAAQ
ncbi:MAG TPA: peptide ABC transporter substrate-binding protein [Alphaproteobacteria bacterium]|nr:peptide ABC transporter substrate-binding protein [Alphaproteobacteria bacterium]